VSQESTAPWISPCAMLAAPHQGLTSRQSRAGRHPPCSPATFPNDPPSADTVSFAPEAANFSDPHSPQGFAWEPERASGGGDYRLAVVAPKKCLTTEWSIHYFPCHS
jgi:hypothetical protein